MEPLEKFKQTTRAFLEQHPQLRYRWTAEDAGRIIGVDIFKQDDNGFDVFWASDGHMLYFRAGDSHHAEIDLDAENIECHFGFLLDLLSDKMRVVEKLAGQKTYKAIIQTWDGTRWVDEDTYGLVFFNYFAPKSEKIHQNRMLKGLSVK